MSELPIKRDNSIVILIMKKTSSLFKTVLFYIFSVKILIENIIKILVFHLFLVVAPQKYQRAASAGDFYLVVISLNLLEFWFVRVAT